MHFPTPQPAPGSLPATFLGQTLWGFPFSIPWLLLLEFSKHSCFPISVYSTKARGSFQQAWKLLEGYNCVWSIVTRSLLQCLTHRRHNTGVLNESINQWRIKWMVHAFQAWEKGCISRANPKDHLMEWSIISPCGDDGNQARTPQGMRCNFGQHLTRRYYPSHLVLSRNYLPSHQVLVTLTFRKQFLKDLWRVADQLLLKNVFHRTHSLCARIRTFINQIKNNFFECI